MTSMRNDLRARSAGNFADDLAERLRSALEIHLAFWPFEVRPAAPGQVSLDVSSLHPFVVHRYEIDAVSCRRQGDRLLVEFVACGKLRSVMLTRGYHVLFEAQLPGLHASRGLPLGSHIESPTVFIVPRLTLVAGPSASVPSDVARV